MGRRKKEAGESVSLFPFLSILACVIGTLTLMITALALGQIDESQSPEAQARAEELKELEAEQPFDEAELERLKRLLADARALREQLEKALEEAERLERDQDDRTRELSRDQRELAELLAEANRLRTRIAELEADVPDLEKTIADLEAELKARKEPPTEAEVVVRPGGSGFDLVPTFVEVTAEGVVINDGREPKRVRRGDLNKPDERFHALLDKVAGTPKGTIIFLVREDGVGTYNTALYVCRTHYGPNGYCPNGKLPILGQGRIDLRLFEKN